MTAIDGNRAAVFENLLRVLKGFRFDGKFYGNLIKDFKTI
jgi:hypothetical protein